MPTLNTHVELYLDDIEISYDYEPAYKGSRDVLGVPLEPDYPAHVNINSVHALGINQNIKYIEKTDITPLLSNRALGQLEAEILEKIDVTK